ncbi:MAG: site-2 protease family protein [Syntrophales bacterium]|nr:site-2 protease family protein [Syntrophales bacterium]
MGLLNLLIQDPLTFILLAVPLLYSIIVHELAHGWVAYRMGDPTAKWLGRLTLNPLKHLDPIGTVMLFIFGFGWAKPVPINLNNIREQRKGLILVSAAGIVANVIFAFVAILLYRILSPSPSGPLGIMLYYLAQINIMLASFNLIPIPPLDGSKILAGFLPERFQYTLARIEPFGFFIIIGLLYLHALDPLTSFFRWLIVTIIGLILP